AMRHLVLKQMEGETVQRRSLPDFHVAAAVFPKLSSATTPSPRLSVNPAMPSSLVPAQDSVAMPDELEERLRFFARQIMSFRRTSLLHPSPELKEKIREIVIHL
ncbi:hypothetical protein AMECASPLE_015813, partial [Ameca splendens]